MYNLQEKKRAIILASIQVFGRHGFYKAKVSDIAKEANIGKGTIYEYFDSKESLFQEMIRFCVDSYFVRLKDTIDKECEPIEKLRKYLLLEKEVMIQHGYIAQMLKEEAHKIGDVVKSIMMEFRHKKISKLEEVIKDGIDKGMFKNTNPYISALILMGGVSQMLFQNIMIPSADSKEIDVDEFLDIFINGIKVI